jgi:hypothetical protein
MYLNTDSQFVRRQFPYYKSTYSFVRIRYSTIFSSQTLSMNMSLAHETQRIWWFLSFEKSPLQVKQAGRNELLHLL